MEREAFSKWPDHMDRRKDLAASSSDFRSEREKERERERKKERKMNVSVKLSVSSSDLSHLDFHTIECSS